MAKNIFQLIQDAIPQLQMQPLPTQLNQFDVFYEWINQQHIFMHYIELKEFDDNGITDNFLLQQLKVDTAAVQSRISEAVERVFAGMDEEEFDLGEDIEAYIDARHSIEEQTEEIIFDHIQQAAEQHQLKLLYIVRENPYWLLIPNLEQGLLDQLLMSFNQSFNKDGDLTLAAY